MKAQNLIRLLGVLSILLAGCMGGTEENITSGNPAEPWSGDAVPVVDVPMYDENWDKGVLLTEGTIEWLTYAYELDDNNSVLVSSFDGSTIVQHTFKTYVLENEYLKVTLVPEFGGRILSIIYKPTGHEELWQNPVGAPYLVGSQIFYHDWLMIYGGIFPTFPEPEHGKTWLLPWQVEVVKNDGQAVEIVMSFIDTIDNPNAPANYPTQDTGIICRYAVWLEDGRAALDTHIELENPGKQSVMYEYWTNTGLAPGSEPGFSTADENTEIIVPIEKVRVPPWYLPLANNEASTGEERVFCLDQLRWFENWKQEGILYAYPDMGGENFWGVINHTNEEGFFRVADNTLTLGLKFWTFGYDSIKTDPFSGAANFDRAFIELWAGVTPEFFWKTELKAGEIYAFDETYSPSVGLTNVSHASDAALIDLYWDESEQLILQLFSMQPEGELLIFIKQNEQILLDTQFQADVVFGNQFVLEGATGAEVEVTIKDSRDTVLFTGIISSR